MSTETSLTIVAICKNEEQDLPGFLANTVPLADEVIIIDDLSTDSTAQIAANAGDKVKFIVSAMDKEKGFAGQRNLGLDAATSDWVLNMDIDERIPSNLYKEIKEAISNTSKNAFRYYRANLFLHRVMKGGGWTSWNQPQLARRGSHVYVNAIHERCKVDGEPASVGQLKNKMWHLNDADYSERLRKSTQYCEIEAKLIVDQGKKVSAIDIFVKPFIEFIKKYIYKQGFKDGVPGLISAMHAATSIFRIYALVWDQQNSIPRTEIEKDLNRDHK
ncbi:MAG: glycosyltransferase family 2 protein [Bacteroidia bacterium]